jgi:hypothetical protein
MLTYRSLLRNFLKESKFLKITPNSFPTFSKAAMALSNVLWYERQKAEL